VYFLRFIHPKAMQELL